MIPFYPPKNFLIILNKIIAPMHQSPNGGVGTYLQPATTKGILISKQSSRGGRTDTYRLCDKAKKDHYATNKEHK